MHEVFEKRHSVRSFQPKEVEQDKLDQVLAAAKSAPSAGHLEAREVIIVREKETKERLAEVCRSQSFIAEAPAALAFFAVPSRSAGKYGKRGEDLYSVQDATIAASFAWLQAVMLNLSACWVGAFEEEKVRAILQAEKGWRPVAILPIGYAK